MNHATTATVTPWIVAGSLSFLLASGVLLAETTPPPPPASRPITEYKNGLAHHRLLVGVIIDRRDAGSLEILADGGEYGVPLEPFAELVDATVEEEGGVTRLKTPLGTVELLPEDLREVGGVTYLRERTLEEKLATPVEFDSAQFALLLDLPWRTDLPDVIPPAAQEPPTPDATPPAASLSTIRTTTSYVDGPDEDFFSSATTVGGRLADGWWRVRYDDDLAGDRELREYSWLRTEGNRRYLVGHQRVNVHPLLGTLELTGVQAAQTNQPLELFSRSLEAQELLSRRLQPLTDVRGVGPAAGIAELRIDGVVEARQVIGLDGVYEFPEVPLDNRRLSRIEVYLYDRHNLAVPVAVHEQTLSASDLLLSDGAVVHLVGAGRDGNVLADTGTDELVGFYQWRYGLTPNLSLEAAAQEGPEGRRAVAGFISRLGLGTILALSAGGSEDGFGYDLAFESLRGPYRVLAQSRLLDDGFAGPESVGRYDHDLELGYRRDGLDLALIGRLAKDPVGRDEFLLPAIAWRPWTRLALRARPDRHGDYRYDLDYRATANARFGVSYQDRTALNFTYRFNSRYYLTLDSQVGDDQPDQHSAVLRWSTRGAWHPYWDVGLLYTQDGDGNGDGAVGYLAGVNADVRSGVRMRLELQNPSGESEDRRIFLGVTADLAFARGRLLSGRRAAVRDDRGAIAGRVGVLQGGDAFADSLRGLNVYVNGRLATRTESGGTFFVGALSPGLYRVEIDAEKLPIELNLQRSSYLAEVAAAAVTRVNFAVHPEFGFAGRLTDAAGAGVPNVEVELLDAAGQRRDAAVTDRFGLYRFDGLPPGTYTLRVSPRTRPEVELPWRTIEIRDDFLFAQDLTLQE